MQALVLDKNGLSYRQDRVKPVPGPGEALLRLRVAGICATDLQLLKGYAGFSGVIGHEFVGEVEEVADAEHKHWLAKRVVGAINIGCQKCQACLWDGPEHCRQRKVLGIRGKDGVFADYFTLPVRNLYAVPDDTDDDRAVFAEPLAAAIRALQQLQGSNLANIGVLGPGRLGLLIAKVLAIHGYDVQVIGRSSAALQMPRQWQLQAALSADIASGFYDGVVDATGTVEGFRQALRVLKPRGILLLKSTYAALEPVDLSIIVVNELQVIGSRCGPFAEALALLRQGCVPVESLIDGRYRLSNGKQAFVQAAQSGVRKILLSP